MPVPNMTGVIVLNTLLIAAIYDLATAIASLSSRPTHVPSIDLFTATISLYLYSRKVSSVHQLICAPLNEI